MLIDVSSTYDKGTDYVIQIQWNETSSQWDKLFGESSSSGTRIIDLDYNYTDFYKKNSGIGESYGNQYVTFSLKK